ncbi:MAG: hypothetical protein IJW28_04305 [Clostridia bacterium]|nr:hypothetical protein [Clostridia bacterium]
MGNMQTHEQIKLLNRALIIALANHSTDLAFNTVELRLPVKIKGRDISFSSNSFEMSDVRGKKTFPSIKDEDVKDPYEYIDSDTADHLSAHENAFVNDTLNNLGVLGRYTYAPINSDAIFSDLVDTVRSKRVLQNPETFHKMKTKFDTMSKVLKTSKLGKVETAIISVAMNSAKLLNISPESLISAEELMASFDNDLNLALSVPSVFDVFYTQAKDSDMYQGGLIFTDIQMKNKVQKYLNGMDINVPEKQFNPRTGRYENPKQSYEVDEEVIDYDHPEEDDDVMGGDDE